MLGYRVPAPDEAMLISGGKTRSKDGAAGAPFRVVTGHGVFVMPWFRKVRFLTLAMKEAEVQEPCVTQQGISILVRAVIAFKVGADSESIVAAGQRFLSDQRQMEVLTGRIFAGHLRSIVGGLTVEQIIRDRQRVATEVLDGSKEEMAKLGLVVDALQIQDIAGDQGTAYIQAMAAPHNAAIQRDAAIAQAEATRASAEKEQESQRAQAEYARDTQIKRAGYKAETDKADAVAAQAGPLAQAEARQKVLQMEAQTAQRAAELRQQELVTEVVRPAEAEAQRVQITAQAAAKQTEIAAEAAAKQKKWTAQGEADATKLNAEADANATRLTGQAEAEKRQAIGLADATAAKAKAEAAAAEGKVSLDQLLIETLPEAIKAAASGLTGANVTLLNGAEGYNQLIGGAIAQGLTIWNSLRESVLTGNGNGHGVNGNGASVTAGEAELQRAAGPTGSH